MRLTKAEKAELKRIASKYSLSYEEVYNVVESQYKFIREKIVSLDLPRDLNEEDFNAQTKNFNIPAIGKLHSSYSVYKKLNKL